MALHDEYDIQLAAGTVSRRHALNLIAGDGISYSISDNSVNDRTDLTINAPTSGGFISGQYQCVPTVYAPATQILKTVSSTTMAAFDSTNINTGSFTAPTSGEVLITANFVGYMSSSTTAALALAAHGTVTPIVSNEFIVVDSAATIARVYNPIFVITGLTTGQTYNFDLVGCATGLQTFSILAQGVSSTTPTLSTRGGPVTIIVQAV